MPGRENQLELRTGHARRKPAAGICAVIAALSPVALQAADADSTDAAASAGPLQEIVVTATRHEESLSKVPISVTALNQEAMDIRGIKDITDVARFTPGVDIDNSGTNNISIRGIASTGGAGTTGIYLDDTPIQMRALAFNPDEALPKSFDIDRIEVLRGPQGTLFGSGSEGGTVRYITVQPSLDKTSFYSREEMSYTQGGSPSYEAGIAGGSPIIDGTLGVRASVWYRRDGGWIDRIDPVTLATDQRNTNYDETMLVRLAAVYAPVEQLHITPSFYYQDRYRNDVESYWPLYSNPGQDRYVSADPTQRSAPDRFYLPALKMEADFGATKLVSNTSYYHRKDTTGYDGTLYNLGFYQTFFGPGFGLQQPLMLDGNGVHLPAGATDYRSPASVDNYQQNLTQEIRLQSNDPAARLIWTTGVFFSVNRQRYLEQIHDPQLNELTEAATGMPYTDIFTDPNGNPVPYDPRYPNDSYFLLTNAKDQQIAVYGEGTYSFTDQWKLTLGVRESHSKYSFDSLTGGPQLFLSPQTVAAEKSENSFTPKVSFSYQYDPRNLYYFTYAKGYRPGGGNNPVPQAACATDFENLGIKGSPLTFNSDTVNSYEIGAKNNIDNRIKLASSIYYIRWNNIQQTVIPPVCQISFIANLGTAIAKGIDLQADVAITDAFTVELATGYTDARYTVDSRLTPLEDPPVVSRGDAITGQSAQPQSPFTASIGLEYRFNVFDLDTFMRVDDEYQSHAKWASPGQDPTTQQFDGANYVLPSNNFASARAGVHVGEWEVAAFVDNLADTHVVTNYEWSIDPGDGESRLQRQFTYRPRTFGFTFTFRSK
ncbi:MAG TPA: TonB-dependent receptor [Steroidobacteraceae bacterium]|jgi:outer membrane receptor protein involved in Fe transport|nr:TonB-dependent receptor [Steroidobacteraceae bacterium]